MMIEKLNFKFTMKKETPLYKLIKLLNDSNVSNKDLISHFLKEEEELFISEIEDALKRGHALGYSEALNVSQGRPESSNAENAMHYHINDIKNTYFNYENIT